MRQNASPNHARGLVWATAAPRYHWKLLPPTGRASMGPRPPAGLLSPPGAFWAAAGKWPGRALLSPFPSVCPLLARWACSRGGCRNSDRVERGLGTSSVYAISCKSWMRWGPQEMGRSENRIAGGAVCAEISAKTPESQRQESQLLPFLATSNKQFRGLLRGVLLARPKVRSSGRGRWALPPGEPQGG